MEHLRQLVHKVLLEVIVKHLNHVVLEGECKVDVANSFAMFAAGLGGKQHSRGR